MNAQLAFSGEIDVEVDNSNNGIADVEEDNSKDSSADVAVENPNGNLSDILYSVIQLYPPSLFFVFIHR